VRLVKLVPLLGMLCRMDIRHACNVIREALDFAERGSTLYPAPELHDAIRALKSYLEAARGQVINSLSVRDELLNTRQGLRHVMPYVLAAETELARDA